MNSTDNERQPVLNKVALWCGTPNTDLNARTYVANRTYKDSKLLQVASRERPVTRYVKSYERFKLKFSVFLYSDSDDKKAIEAFMDDVAKKAKKEDVTDAVSKASMSSFRYLDKYYKETN